MMTRAWATGVGCVILASGLVSPAARAAGDSVTYEVLSDSIGVAGIEYVDSRQRVLIRDVALPWRLDADVPNIGSSQLRADWRPAAQVRKWVTVRIIYQGKVLCQSTLDIGNATCYGNTPHSA